MQKNSWKVLSINSMVFVLCLFGFVFIGKQNYDIQYQIIIIVFAFGSLIIFSMREIKELSRNGLIKFSLLQTTIFLMTFNLIGFVFYPGLVKDIIPFSMPHLKNTVFLFFTFFFPILLVIILLKIFTRK